jgi:hypothetical protein
MILDFPGAGRNSFFPLFALDEVQDVLLPIGQHVLPFSQNEGHGKFK